jgi:prophage antirepressor-like protein
MTGSYIKPFLFEGEHVVREVEQAGKPWFVAADVCAIHGIKNVTQAVAPLDPDERSMFNIGRQGDVLIISESGLYTLILRSRDATKPGTVAHRFRKWVTSEVLPALRAGNDTTANEAVPGMTEDIQMLDSLKLRKVNMCHRLFGERAGQQMWRKVDLEWVPAMASVFRQGDMFDGDAPPGSVTITVTPPEMRKAA